MVCRVKTPAARVADAGAGDAETITARVSVCLKGACTTTDFASAGGSSAPGDLLALEIANDAQSSCVTPKSATLVSRALAPTWMNLISPVCFDEPIRYQGLARTAPSDASDVSPAYFAGTRRNGSDVASADFGGVVLEPGPGAANLAPVAAPDKLVTP
jgi:hypothetical protein